MKDAAGKGKPAGKQGFWTERLQGQIDKAKDVKKKANALKADVDETKD